MEDREEKEVVSTQLCYDCAFKHLSCAYVAWAEVVNGYPTPDHIAKVVGHMAHAEEHLLERHPDIAKAIREARKLFWDSQIFEMQSRPAFEMLLEDLWERVVEAEGGEAGGNDGEEDEAEGTGAE
jgi:hypothetical protein